MLQREIIKTEVNQGDFRKSILNVGDFTRKCKSRYYTNTGELKCMA